MKYIKAFAAHPLTVKHVALLLIMISSVTAHGWVYSPVSKNEMAFHHY